jgi:hypothetical protein
MDLLTIVVIIVFVGIVFGGIGTRGRWGGR